MIDIGSKIRSERIGKKISQKQLAEILGVKQNTVSQYEKNVKRPSYEVMLALAIYFNVSLDYLFGMED